jgi:biopolymer transport protein ExbB
LGFALTLAMLAVAAPAFAQDATTAPAREPAVQTPVATGNPAPDAPVAETQAPSAEARASAASQPAANQPAGVQTTPAADAAAGAVTQSATALEGQPSLTVSPDVPGSPGNNASALPHDLSPWGMFMSADLAVKAVMIGLVFASVITWTVWVAKSLEITAAKLTLRGALRAILNARTLSEAVEGVARQRGAGASLVEAAAEEASLSATVVGHGSFEGIKERVASRLARIQAHAGRRLTRGTGVLATIGSTAPFVGLFGTVWGIMNAFIGISTRTTNLAVVAPGIAEALLATAAGLVAAIPAVVIYNIFARSVSSYKATLADAAAGVERLVSRDLDHSLLAAPERVAGYRRTSPAAGLDVMRSAAAE